MADTNYLFNPGTPEEAYRIGAHDDVASPSYIPELKGAEGLRALLNHVETLEARNPVMVPAAKWEWLRTKNEVTTRTDSEGNEKGAQEVADLESAHPLVYYDPPELYNYNRAKTLTNYLFRYPKYSKEEFERNLREQQYSEAMQELPQFAQPFVHAHINRVLKETSGASLVSPDDRKVTTTSEAWTQLSSENFEGYFGDIVTHAARRPSAVLVPPVPQLQATWNDGIADAWLSSNQIMAEISDKEGVDSYLHMYLNYQSLDPDAAEDTASQSLQLLEEELESQKYAGIALTMHHPNRIWQTGRAARMDTFMQRISRIGTNFHLPIICPRSEWFGFYSTDFGIQGFSSLLNGAWQYQQYSSEGGPSGADQYGRIMIPNQARALKLEADNEQDLEGYLEANESLPEAEGLPAVPPTYSPEGDDLRERYGTSPEFRRTFGKPRRLAHIMEAQQFREQRALGSDTPAKEYLKRSKNPYVEI